MLREGERAHLAGHSNTAAIFHTVHKDRSRSSVETEEGQRAMIAIPIVKYEDLSGVWSGRRQIDRQTDNCGQYF